MNVASTKSVYGWRYDNYVVITNYITEKFDRGSDTHKVIERSYPVTLYTKTGQEINDTKGKNVDRKI